jgi:hypothetical protein
VLLHGLLSFTQLYGLYRTTQAVDEIISICDSDLAVVCAGHSCVDVFLLKMAVSRTVLGSAQFALIVNHLDWQERLMIMSNGGTEVIMAARKKAG